ncbi:hypothetical protein V6N13_085302 [Hibiscus sabdariffa]
MKPLLSASTELMHHQPNNSLVLSRINTDELDLLNHHYHTSQFLVDATCPIESQNVRSLPSQTNQLGQNRIEIPMSSRLNQRHPSQDSGRTSGNQRTAAAISHESRELLEEKIKKLTAETVKYWKSLSILHMKLKKEMKKLDANTKKMVVKVTFNSDKSRYKALRIAVGLSGVESASLKGDDKSRIELTGHAVDLVKLTSLLRKNVGHAEMVSIADYVSTPYYPQYYYHPVPSYGYVEDHEPSCSIMQVETRTADSQ